MMGQKNGQAKTPVLSESLVGSQHFDLIRENRQVSEFHGRMLGELFGVIGGGPALEDQAVRQTDHPEIANSIAEQALQHAFQPILFREDA